MLVKMRFFCGYGKSHANSQVRRKATMHRTRFPSPPILFATLAAGPTAATTLADGLLMLAPLRLADAGATLRLAGAATALADGLQNAGHTGSC